MRKAFVDTLRELAAEDERTVLLTADLGYNVVEPFAEEFPSRFFNVGVAEQNMVGVATGMAEAGFIPYIYSISNFSVLRPFEFIRQGPVQHRLPVRIVSVGGGFEYGTNGFSHWGLEDVAVMRTQPNMSVVVPCDDAQAAAAVRATHGIDGPVYLRLSKNGGLALRGLDGAFKFGRCDLVRTGVDAVVVATGTAALNALRAADRLYDEQRISASVLVVSTLNPSPVDGIAEAIQSFARVVTVESHYTTGGLGSMVCEIVAEAGLRCRVTRCGVKRMPAGTVGSQAYMEELHGISSDKIVETVHGLF